MSIEKHFDIPFIGSMALKEKQIQQVFRPIIAVHKWFARRPGTLFRGLILAEFGNRPINEIYFHPNDFQGKLIADPFMGGGTPLIEANRVGCDVIGYDINPMSVWIVREEMAHINVKSYLQTTKDLITFLEPQIGDSYITDCPHYGDLDVPAKYYIWVKILDCIKCNKSFDLFPGYILAKNARHPNHVLICANCGELNEVGNLNKLGNCRNCGSDLIVEGPAKRSHCICPHCGEKNQYPRNNSGPPKHRLVAIEYYNPKRYGKHIGRFFKKPDQKDLRKIEISNSKWESKEPHFVPNQEILPGDETNRLIRWGYHNYRDLFNSRQLLGLELSCEFINNLSDERLRHALATNLSDLLRYQNMLCRYDTMSLKSLDIFSIHGFPVGLIQCESNLLGIKNGKGENIGSGGWKNIIEKYYQAKLYCFHPYEINRHKNQNLRIPIKGEWIGDNYLNRRPRLINIQCENSSTIKLKKASLDAVFTDPPYFSNVQYSELMDFCYVWLRRLVGNDTECFERESTRSPEEVSGNVTQSRGLNHFTEALSAVYRNMSQALKPGAPLVFTFHHNLLDAYFSIGTAILDSGLNCYATLPCPAEMGGSIHIHGTESSIVDTVFVCRSHGQTRLGQYFENLDQLEDVVHKDLVMLRQAGMKPSIGDIRCIVFGHVTRKAICDLRNEWDSSLATKTRLSTIQESIKNIGDNQKLINKLYKSSNNIINKNLVPLFED